MKTNKKESQVALNLIHGMSESMGTDACRKAGIKLYPAWIARNGPRVYVTIPEDEE